MFDDYPHVQDPDQTLAQTQLPWPEQPEHPYSTPTYEQNGSGAAADPDYAYSAAPTQQQRPVRPEQLIRNRNFNNAASTLPGQPLAKLAYMWRSDPAYKVLFIAIGTILLASIIVVVLIIHALTPASQTASTASTTDTNAATTSTNSATSVQATPTPIPPTPVPTPVPTVVPVPVIPPTAIPPTPTQAPQQLTLQITNAPAIVDNNSTISINVHANQPGVSVKLNIQYTVIPNNGTTVSHTTDANGDVTLHWHAIVFTFKRSSSVVARLTAVAMDQNGQQVASQTVTVQINLR